MSEKKNLVTKLVEVMQSVGYIQKLGWNKNMSYHFVQEADVLEALRKELAGRNVMMIPSVDKVEIREKATKSGGLDLVTSAEVFYTFMDGDSDEKITFKMAGQGQDSGDKGIYKAITGATKYALMKTFLIPTGDDPEADEKTDERNTGKPTQTPVQPQNIKTEADYEQAAKEDVERMAKEQQEDKPPAGDLLPIYQSLIGYATQQGYIKGEGKDADIKAFKEVLTKLAAEKKISSAVPYIGKAMIWSREDMTTIGLAIREPYEELPF